MKGSFATTCPSNLERNGNETQGMGMRLGLEWNGDSQCVEHSKESGEGEANGHHALHLHLYSEAAGRQDLSNVVKQDTHTIVRSRLALFNISSFFSGHKSAHQLFLENLSEWYVPSFFFCPGCWPG